MEKRYYCQPIKRYVCFLYQYVDNSLKVLMIAHTTGEVLDYITAPYLSPRKLCAYIDNKTFPWLSDWLVEKGIAWPTKRVICEDGFYYFEFKFKKEI